MGASIKGHDYGPPSELRTVDEDLANYSRVNFFELLIPLTVVHDGPSSVLRTVNAIVGCTCRFCEKTNFWSILAMWCYNFFSLGEFK